MKIKTTPPKRKVAQDTVIVFALLLVAAFFSYAFRLILARNLSLKNFGLFFAVVAFLGIVNTFRDLGIGQSMIYFVPRFIAKKQHSRLKEFITKILRIEFWTSLVSMLIIISLADYLAQNYFHYGSIATIILFAIAYFFNSLELNIQVMFNAFQNQKIHAVHNIVRTFLILVFAAFASFSSYKNDINIYVYAQLLTYVIVLIIFGAIFYKKIYPKDVKKSNNKIVLKDVFLFGLIATGAQLCYFFITTTDTVFLTYMTTLENVGLYNAVIPIVTLLLYFTMALGTVITPRISELTAHKKFDDIRFLWEKSIKYILITTLPVVGLLVLYPDVILRIMFGEQFVAASTTLIIMGSGIIFFGLSQINMSFLLSIIGPKKNLVIYVIATVVNIVLNLILIPKYSIEGAATATIISYMLLFIISMIVLLKIIRLELKIWGFILIGISASVYILLVNYLKNSLDMPLLAELILIFLISGAVYVSLLFALKIITSEELKSIKNAILK